MDSKIAKLIDYYRSCYQSDNRQLEIYDFLNVKIENKLYLSEKEELLTADAPFVAVDSQKAEALLKKQRLFEQEKVLLYGVFFVCGQYVDAKGDVQKLCSPLFYYPAKIEERDGFHYLSIDSKQQRINFPLISLLTDGDQNELLQDADFALLPKDVIGFEDVGTIVRFFKKFFPHVNTDELYSYPSNVKVHALRKAQKEEGASLVLLPSSIVGLVPQSANTRGVINELKELAASHDVSTPLRALLQEEIVEAKPYTQGDIPMLLSNAQKDILKSSSTHPLTFIVGPPGTGKSYTIGAIAVEHMSRGESVLIASRTNEAVDAISETVVRQVGSDAFMMRGGKKRNYLTPLRRYLKALLTRKNTFAFLKVALGLDSKMRGHALAYLLETTEEDIVEEKRLRNELEATFQKRLKQEVRWGALLSKQKLGLWQKLKKGYISFQNKMQKPLWEYSQELGAIDRRLLEKIIEGFMLRYIKNVKYSLKHDWKTLNHFHEALKEANDTEKLNRLRSIEFTKLLKAFPIWLTNLADVKDLLPLENEMFDVAIIDEATQCDIASCLPIIQRAKRLVIAGDPNQLRHVSFLSKQLQSVLQTKFQLEGTDNRLLNYRDHSILDVVMAALHSSEQIALLEEHYRSLPPIISFSNEHFYDGALKIMTSKAYENEKALCFIHCQGKRDDEGVNSIEAKRLLADVRKIVKAEKALNKNIAHSIGILSPFRAQVEFLSQEILNGFSTGEIEKHSIKVGTAYHFQGSERDFMFLSFAVDASSHHAVHIHINKEDVFNVSITRAKYKQYVYLSINKDEMKRGHLLEKYVNQEEVSTPVVNKDKDYDVFVEEVVALLKKKKMPYWIGTVVAGQKIDVLVKKNEGYLAIDLIGYAGEFEEAYDLDALRILARANVDVFPLSYANWHFRHTESYQELCKSLGVSARK